MGYLKSVRPLACLFLGMVVLASFKISTGNISASAYRLAVAIVCIGFATMAQNDLRDRWHDAKKGKRFALENEKPFKLFVIFLWAVAILVSCLASRTNINFIGFFSVLIIVGLVYSELRQVPMAPNLVMALYVGSPALLPVFAGVRTIWLCWILFFGVTVVMFAREILKDFDDREIDPGYKWTLVQWARLGQKDVRIKGDISPKTVGRLKLTLDIGMTLLMFWLIFR